LLYFFLDVPTWGEELVARQNVYLEILRFAEEMGVEFAFPTQTLHVESFPEKQSSPKHTEVNETLLKSQAQAFGPRGQLSRPLGLGYYQPPYKER